MVDHSPGACAAAQRARRAGGAHTGTHSHLPVPTQDGYVTRVPPHAVTLDAVERALLHNTGSSHVAIVRELDAGPPRLLRRAEVCHLCRQLANGERDAPLALQGYVQPLGDVCHVVTYLDTFGSVTCHVAQRAFSVRYDGADAAAAPTAAADASSDVVIKLQLRKVMRAIAQYYDRAHGLRLATLVCDFVRDAKSCIHLLGVERVEWSGEPPPIRPPQPHAAAAVVQRPMSAPPARPTLERRLPAVPRLVAQMARELQALKSELVFQHERAEAAASKVAALTREREAGERTAAARLQQAEDKLSAASAELEELRAERAALSTRASALDAKSSTLEGETAQLQARLSEERATTMRALKQYQSRDGALAVRNGVLEAEVRRLEGLLREERAAVLALKRQTLSYQDELDEARRSGPDGTTDVGMRDVLLAAAPLLDRQSNPTGERYAVQKVLHTHSTELRAAFLYYCQLDASFAETWPPRMHQQQWFAFCKDTDTAGAWERRERMSFGCVCGGDVRVML